MTIAGGVCAVHTAGSLGRCRALLPLQLLPAESVRPPGWKKKKEANLSWRVKSLLSSSSQSSSHCFLSDSSSSFSSHSAQDVRRTQRRDTPAPQTLLKFLKLVVLLDVGNVGTLQVAHSQVVLLLHRGKREGAVAFPRRGLGTAAQRRAEFSGTGGMMGGLLREPERETLAPGITLGKRANDGAVVMVMQHT